MKERFKAELTVYRIILHDPHTPRRIKWLLGGAIAYTLSPIIPVLGHLDDVVIVSALVFFGLKLIPKEVVEDCRRRVSASH